MIVFQYQSVNDNFLNKLEYFFVPHSIWVGVEDTFPFSESRVVQLKVGRRLMSIQSNAIILVSRWSNFYILLCWKIHYNLHVLYTKYVWKGSIDWTDDLIDVCILGFLIKFFFHTKLNYHICLKMTPNSSMIDEHSMYYKVYKVLRITIVK